MSRFESCLSLILHYEGGYSDHPADRGGATACGITQRTFDTWRASKGLEEQPVRFISMEEVQDIYHESYWLPTCPLLSPPLDLVFFDSAVNSGQKRASKLLQEALGVSPDGVIGPMTKAALEASEPVEVALEMIKEREEFYRGIVERDPSQKVFMKGWLNRLNLLRKEIRR